MTFVRQRESEQVRGKVQDIWQSKDLHGYMITHGRQEKKGERRVGKGQNEEEADAGGGFIQALKNYGLF